MKTPRAELDALALRYKREPKLRARIKARNRVYRMLNRWMAQWIKSQETSAKQGPMRQGRRRQ